MRSLLRPLLAAALLAPCASTLAGAQTIGSPQVSINHEDLAREFLVLVEESLEKSHTLG